MCGLVKGSRVKFGLLKTWGAKLLRAVTKASAVVEKKVGAPLPNVSNVMDSDVLHFVLIVLKGTTDIILLDELYKIYKVRFRYDGVWGGALTTHTDRGAAPTFTGPSTNSLVGLFLSRHYTEFLYTIGLKRIASCNEGEAHPC